MYLSHFIIRCVTQFVFPILMTTRIYGIRVPSRVGGAEKEYSPWKAGVFSTIERHGHQTDGGQLLSSKICYCVL